MGYAVALGVILFCGLFDERLQEEVLIEQATKRPPRYSIMAVLWHRYPHPHADCAPQWIADLGSESFRDREKATLNIRRWLGDDYPKALALRELGQQQKDPECRRRLFAIAGHDFNLQLDEIQLPELPGIFRLVNARHGGAEKNDGCDDIDRSVPMNWLTYYYYARAINAHGEGVWEAGHNFETFATRVLVRDLLRRQVSVADIKAMLEDMLNRNNMYPRLFGPPNDFMRYVLPARHHYFVPRVRGFDD